MCVCQQQDKNIRDFDGLRFVVARFREDLAWVPGLVSAFPGSRCTVYNKGADDVDIDVDVDVDARKHDDLDIRVARLDNVGRESHTYLHHIIESFGSSPPADEITVFLQGDPFDHCEGGPAGLSDLVYAGVSEIATRGSCFENVGTRVITIEGGFPRFHPTIRDELAQTCRDVLGSELPASYRFSAGALFMVARRSVFARPVGFYEKAIGHVDSEVNPVRGFCFERLWPLIFSA